MQITLATYITSERKDGQLVHVCRPLHQAAPEVRDSMLRVALQRFASQIRSRLHQLIESGKGDQLAQWEFDPQQEVKKLKLRLTLRDRTIDWRLLIVSRMNGSSWTHFSPALPQVWFDSSSLADLEGRAELSYTRWCQEYLQEDPDGVIPDLSLKGEAWIEPLDIEIASLERKKKTRAGGLAFLQGSGKMRGDVELRNVGQALDELAVEFGPAVGREESVDLLERLLARRDHQSILLVGPSGVGKTAVIRDCVARRHRQQSERRRGKDLTWLLSPQRLISGMSYMGQWEERWLAILKEAARKDHILYIDDLLGLLTAGITRDSRLCLADVLKSFTSQHPVRLLSEISAEGLAILRRRDRSLADQFHLLHLAEMDESKTLQIMQKVAANLEAERQVAFQPLVLKEIVDKQQTLAPHRAFPGKAIEVLQNLSRLGVRSIGHHRLKEYFKRTTGVSERMLDPNPDRRDPLQRSLERRLIGQPNAIESAQRVILSACFRLSPPDRPLGVLLFLGPTGVGKTECAKAINATLFADESHLLRFDMNEITTASAAEQLIGTFDEPDGRLTSAIRRFPFSVVLFDEIEKAHPDVFDYLLQVIGEGRLTDAHGRTVDFRNAVIIMTSNLGASDAQSSLGFEQQSTSQETYARAAQRFFRPEFFNRIDDVVVFRRLAREHIERIAELQVSRMLQRDGLWQREVYARVQPAVIQWVVDQGFQPELGARAIKRALENHLVQPIGDLLSGTPENFSYWVDISRRVTESTPAERSSPLVLQKFALQVAPTKPAQGIQSTPEFMAMAEMLLEQFQAALQQHQQEPQTADSPGSEFDRVHYYAIHEQVFRCKDLLRELKNGTSAMQGNSLRPAQPVATPVKRGFSPRAISERRHQIEFQADQDIQDAIEDADRVWSTQDVGSAVTTLGQSLQTAGMMLKFAHRPRTWNVEFRFGSSDCSLDGLNALVFDREPGMTRNSPAVKVWWDPVLAPAHALINALVNTLTHCFQYEVTMHPTNSLRFQISGVACQGVIEPLLGTYRVRGFEGWRGIGALVASTEDHLASPWDQTLDHHETSEMPPHSWQQIQGEIGSDFLDHRTGLRLDFSASLDEWQAWWIQLLPSCEELFQAMGSHHAP